jgi:catechol 2,3-dioxygenase-like lactoylglutathione lyase family enzyme
MISHLQLVTIYVSDLEKALDFYTHKLGFQKLAEWDDGRGERLYFIAPAEAKETEIALYAPPAGDGRIGATSGIVFTARDVRATYEEMRQRGVHFTQELVVLPYGQDGGDLEATFLDPDGNTFLLHS